MAKKPLKSGIHEDEEWLDHDASLVDEEALIDMLEELRAQNCHSGRE